MVQSNKLTGYLEQSTLSDSPRTFTGTTLRYGGIT